MNRVFNQQIDTKDGIKQVNEIFINEVNKNLDFLKYFKASKRSEAQRIFRRLAGRTIVIVDALIENEETKIFGEYLNNHFKNGSLYIESEKPWKVIFEENDFLCDETEVHFVALKWLLNASVSIPEYHFPKITGKQQFKDFYLVKVDESYPTLKIFGYDKIKADLEKEELGEII